jgi:hypothetical protein
VNHRQVVAPAQVGQFGDCRLVGEAGDSEVTGVDFQQHRRLGRDRRLVVAGVRSVGRTDLNQCRAALAHDIRDAKAAANLDCFAPRENHCAPRRQRAEREDGGRRVVVDDQRRFRTGQYRQQRLNFRHPPAALAGD